METKIEDTSDETDVISLSIGRRKTELFCSNFNESLKKEIETEVEICPDISAVFYDCFDEDLDLPVEENYGDKLEKNYENVGFNSFCEVIQNVPENTAEENGAKRGRKVAGHEKLERRIDATEAERSAALPVVDQVSKLKTSNYTFHCYHCKKSFATELKLRNHLKISPKICQLCEARFTHRCIFNSHLRAHEADKRVCITCSGEFFRPTQPGSGDALDERRAQDVNRCAKCAAVKLADGSLRCRYCDETFTGRPLLDEHERASHDPVKPFECDICGQRFGLMHQIKRHIEVLHNGGVRYQCKLCQKFFRWDSCLRTHMKTHTNERPHKCAFCQYSFRRPCDLRRHMITHTNEKKFSCTQCDKLFTRNSSMLRHLRTHFGEKPYLCNVCGKRFNESFFLKEHMESHSENRSYFYCESCNKRFNNRRVLRMHAKKHEKTVHILKMTNED